MRVCVREGTSVCLEDRQGGPLWITTGTRTRLTCAPSCARSHLPAFPSLLFLAVNTDTETAVVNVTYSTKEEAKE